MSTLKRPMSVTTPLSVIKENPVTLRVQSASVGKSHSQGGLQRISSAPLTVSRERPTDPPKAPITRNVVQPRLKSEFDMFDLIKRREDVPSYVLTVRYRTAGERIKRRQTAATISRRRRRAESFAESEGGESTVTTVSDIAEPEYFKEEYDFDADDMPEDDTHLDFSRHPGTIAQEVYMRQCRRLHVTPSQRFYDNLALDKMVIRRQRLGLDGMKACAEALTKATHIRSVDLSENDLGVVGGIYVAEIIRENDCITELNVSENGLGGDGVRPLVNIIARSDNITYINFSGNGLSDPDAAIVCPIIEETQHLKYLDLSHNQFREAGGQAIANALLWNDTLETLDLSWNHLRYKGASKLAQCLTGNSGLKVLKVAWNGFYLTGCKALAQSLPRNSTLEELDLTCNRVDPECLGVLMEGLKLNTTLRTLRLGQNPIGSVSAIFLLNLLKEYPSVGLTEIDLCDQEVDMAFLSLLEEIRMARPLVVKYGRVKDKIIDDEDELNLLNENPVVILIEFGRLLGFRLIDLFSSLDKDGSKTLDHNEIQTGLMAVNIPLSSNSIKQLIKKLDRDKDGEIDLGELRLGEMHYKKHLSKFNAIKAVNGNILSTEVGRVREILHKLLAKKMSGNPAFKRNVDSMKTLLKLGGEKRLSQNLLTRLDQTTQPTNVI